MLENYGSIRISSRQGQSRTSEERQSLREMKIQKQITQQLVQLQTFIGKSEFDMIMYDQIQHIPHDLDQINENDSREISKSDFDFSHRSQDDVIISHEMEVTETNSSGGRFYFLFYFALYLLLLLLLFLIIF
jgi:hypothetical protein